MKVLIIGKNGQLAWELQKTLPGTVVHLALARNEIELACFESVRQKVISFDPQIIINASAYNSVDGAESDAESAFLINNLGVKHLAMVAKELNVRLIHVSTDFIFNGVKKTAYEVFDQPDPINVYGKSKLAGEKSIQALYPQSSVIIRTSWLYSSHGNNFVKTVLKLLREKEELRVVCDQTACPTYARELARAIWRIVQLKTPRLIYHWSDLGVASWYDFAIVIQNLAFEKRLITKKITIKRIQTGEHASLAKRPRFSLLALDNSDLDFKAHNWQENLSIMLNEYRKTNRIV